MKRPEKYYLPFVFFLCSLFCFAQQNKIDSLQKLLLTQKEDTNKVITLNLVSREFELTGDFDKGINYSLDALKLAQKINFKKGIAQAYNELGNSNKEMGNYPNAMKNHFESLKIREEIGDKRGIAASYNNIGEVYRVQGDYPFALKNYFAALKINEEMGNKNWIAKNYNNIGIIYDNQGNYPDALKKYLACLKISEELGNKYVIAGSYSNIAGIYNTLGDRESNHENKKKFYSDAMKNELAALKIRGEIGDKLGITTSYIGLGAVNNRIEKLAEAKRYYNEALSLSKKIGSKRSIKDSYSGLSELDSTQGDFKSAVENYKMYIIYRDSLNNEENTKKTVQAQMNYEFDKKETQAKAEQDKKDAVAVAESRKQRIILYSVIGGLLLVVLFAGFIYRSLIQIKKKNILITEQKKKIEEKQKEILDSIRYAKRIQDAMLPRESYIEKTIRRLKKLPPMS